MSTRIERPYATTQVFVPITTDWSRGPTTKQAQMSPNQAEELAHQLIIAAAEVRAQRQMTARG
jgi:hypothetical protein